MATIAVTGAASGIGYATCSMLNALGHRTIGVDIKTADIVADLGSPRGRQSAIEQTLDRSGKQLDGLLLAAGLGPYCDAAAILAVNYFGSTALLEGLYHSLSVSGQGSAVVIASVAAQVTDFTPGLGLDDCIQACLDGDEDRALSLASSLDGILAYIAAKRALALKARSLAPKWGETSTRLNVVCPGTIKTPMLDGVLQMGEVGEQTATQHIPLDRYAEPEEIAGPVCFLLGPDASYVHGISMIVDGGCDVITRPEAV